MRQLFTQGSGKTGSSCANKKWTFLGLALLGLFNGNIMAQVANPFGFEDNLTGNWTGTASSETVSINSAAANSRTGAYSLKVTTTSTGTGNKQWYSTAPYLTSGSNIYMHFVYWAKAQDAGTSVDASYRYVTALPPTGSGSSANAASGAAVALSTTQWTRVTNTATTSSLRYYMPGPRKTASTGATVWYMDDGILFTSSNAVVDTLDPGAPAALAGTASGNLISLNWTSNTDNGVGATGVTATLLLRTVNTNAAPPELNDQGVYAAAGGAAGTRTVGDWTVVNDNIGATATTYLDATAPAGNVKYAVVLRDLAYNYSTAAVSSVLTVGNPVPTIFLDTTGFNADLGTVMLGGTSVEPHYAVNGLNLTGNVTVTAPAGFEVSRTSGAGYASTLSLAPTTGTLPATVIYVRFSPAAASGLVSATITHTAAAAVNKNLAVSGTGIAIEPMHTGSISFSTVRSTRISVNLPTIGNGNGRIIVVGNGADVSYVPIDGIAPTGVNANYALATDQGTGDRIVYNGAGSGSNVVTVMGLSPNTTYYFAVFEYNVGTGSSHNYLPLSPVTAVARTADNDLDVNTPSLAAQIKAYPNPTEGLLMIDAPVPVNVIVRDLTGRTVYQAQQARQLDLQSLAADTYLLTITDVQGLPIKQERIVKSR
jgi:hypothetical protein